MKDVGIFTAIRCVLCPFGILCDHLLYLMVIWYIFLVLVCCTKKNLATLSMMVRLRLLWRRGAVDILVTNLVTLQEAENYQTKLT
jgi:hypothetical protein